MRVTPWPFFAELDHEIVIDYGGLFSNNCFCFERIIWLYWMVWCLFLFALIFLTHTLMHALNLLKLSTSSHNESAYNSVFNCKFKRSFELKPNQILPLGIWLQPELQAVGFKKKDVLHCSVPSKPPWLLKRPQTDFSMHASCKESTPPEIFRTKYHEICDQYQDYCKLYTDGSMNGDQVGSATICGSTS